MIKPESLWGLFKSCTDSKWLGDICRKLGKQDISLDFGQEQMYKSIAQDSEWMDEDMEKKREKWKKRQVKSRSSRVVTPCHALSRSKGVTERDTPPSRGVTPLSTYLSTYLSTNTHSNECVREPRARGDVPDRKTVVEAAVSVMGVPESYAVWWYGEMVARDWQRSDATHVTNGNWRSALKSWWNRESDERKAEIEREFRKDHAPPPAVKASDWMLCQERCEHFQGGRCLKGMAYPPNVGNPPAPPEECRHYTHSRDDA